MSLKTGDYIICKTFTNDQDILDLLGANIISYSDSLIYLTQNKKYQILSVDKDWYDDEVFYMIKNDKNQVMSYNPNLFYSVSELRKEKLKRIKK